MTTLFELIEIQLTPGSSPADSIEPTLPEAVLNYKNFLKKNSKKILVKNDSISYECVLHKDAAYLALNRDDAIRLAWKLLFIELENKSDEIDKLNLDTLSEQLGEKLERHLKLIYEKWDAYIDNLDIEHTSKKWREEYKNGAYRNDSCTYEDTFKVRYKTNIAYSPIAEGNRSTKVIFVKDVVQNTEIKDIVESSPEALSLALYLVERRNTFIAFSDKPFSKDELLGKSKAIQAVIPYKEFKSIFNKIISQFNHLVSHLSPASTKKGAKLASKIYEETKIENKKVFVPFSVFHKAKKVFVSEQKSIHFIKNDIVEQMQDLNKKKNYLIDKCLHLLGYARNQILSDKITLLTEVETHADNRTLNIYTLEKLIEKQTSGNWKNIISFGNDKSRTEIIIEETKKYLKTTYPNSSELANILLMWESSKTDMKVDQYLGEGLNLKTWRELHSMMDPTGKAALKEMLDFYIAKLFEEKKLRFKDAYPNCDMEQLKKEVQKHFHDKIFHSKQRSLNISYELDYLSYIPDFILERDKGAFPSNDELNNILADQTNWKNGKYHGKNHNSRFNFQKCTHNNGESYLLIHYTQRDTDDTTTRPLYSAKDLNKTLRGGKIADGSQGVVRAAQKIYLKKDGNIDDARMLHPWIARKLDYENGADLLPELFYDKNQSLSIHVRETGNPNKNSKHESHAPFLLGKDLFDYLKLIKIYPAHVKEILYQCLIQIKEMQEDGYTHCDIKPENIMIYIDEKQKLYVDIIDRGLAVSTKVTYKGMLGTKGYMPPWEHKNLDADLYALGCTIKECLKAYTTKKDSKGLTQIIWNDKSQDTDLIKKHLFNIAHQLMNSHNTTEPNFAMDDLNRFIENTRNIPIPSATATSSRRPT